MWLRIIYFGLFGHLILGQFERHLEYTIQENQPPGIQVGHISSDMNHLQKDVESKIFDKSYSFLMRDRNEYFQLDSTTSTLKTIKIIDLEILCPKNCNEKGIGYINLVVNVWKGNQLHGVIQVKIVVIDQNDNFPTFPMKVFEKKIKEVLYGIGKFIELPKAIDRDITSENNKIFYKLTEQCDMFDLQVTNESNPRLVLLKDTDYEIENKYILTLMAWNMKSSSMKAYLEIKIEVIDINDCEPVFPNTFMEFKLDENTKIGKLITKLEAIDKDKNSKLIYGMNTATKQSNKDTFSIKESGEVTLMKELDVEILNEYDISVFATDGEFTANAKLRIVIKDVNNHPPSYNLNPAIFSIEENQPPQILVGQVIVSDVDSPEVNGDIRCNEPFGKSNLQSVVFLPDPANNPAALKYDMYSRVSLDREEGAVKLIYLICQDGGLHERLTSTLTASLLVLDVNDNQPMFEKPHYIAEIMENNIIGDKITQVRAIDKDYMDNAVIIYSIMSVPSSKMFFIDQNSGWIKVMRELDREEKDKFQLIIFATNRPPMHLFTATTTVDIKVLDINDNVPQLKSPNQFHFMENLKPNSFVGNINAEDKDLGNNGKIVFSSISTKFDDIFEVKQNGSIFSKISFDREKEEKYCLTIRMNDLGVPQSHTVTGTICIIIMDANDNPPIIFVKSLQVGQFPTETEKQNYSTINVDNIIVSVYETVRHIIATVSANDLDQNENAQTTFMLEEINGNINSVSSLFMIDESDGAIKFSRVMSRDHIGDYVLRIIAHDKGVPSLNSEKIIKVQIKDIPPSSFVQVSNVQVTGNVLIVIILSTISAFLTAILIGAILCMIRPCSPSQSSTFNYQQNPQNINPGEQLQKLPSNYYTINPYRHFELYDQELMKTMSQNEQSYGNATLDLHQKNNLEKIDFLKYETPRMYMSQNTLCHVDHMVGNPSGCSCEPGVCIRYGSHNKSNFLSASREEQFSDSGRGVSDDDMKALNHNGSLASSSKALASVYGTYISGEVSSTIPWRNNFRSLITREKDEYNNEPIFNNIHNNFMTPVTFGQVLNFPTKSFHSTYNFDTINQSSNLRSDSYDSLSNSQQQNTTIRSTNILSDKLPEHFSLNNKSDEYIE